MDQAFMDGAEESFVLPLVEPRHGNFDPKRPQTCRLGNFLGRYGDFQAGGRDGVGFEVFHCVVGGAGSQARKQEFGRSHGSVRAAIDGWLIGYQTVAASDGLKPNVVQMMNGNFHISIGL
jgi:hypothetical protein